MPFGDLAGVAEISGLLSRIYPRRSSLITSSAREQEDKRRDQVIVGGPIHNQYANQLICGDLSAATPDTSIVFDATNRYVRVGETELGPDLDLNFLSNIPQVEYAVVYFTKAPIPLTRPPTISAAGAVPVTNPMDRAVPAARLV